MMHVCVHVYVHVCECVCCVCAMCGQECEAVLASDYFLGAHVPVSDFMDAAKLQMFQLYCRLHTTVSLE